MALPVVLVEGPDDKHVVAQLLRHAGIEWEKHVSVKDKGGYSVLRDDLRTEIRASDVPAIAVVVDADVDPAARWQSLRSVALDMGYFADSQPAAAGTVFTPPAGLPALKSAGILEDFVTRMIPSGDAVWEHAIQATEALPVRRFRDVDLPKATIHSWLAWQNDPGMLMGQAIDRKVLVPDSEIASQFMAWIRRLGIEPKPPVPFRSPWS